MCDTVADCYITDSDGMVTSNKCGDPNNNCICTPTGCMPSSCSADSDCAKFGSGCVCYDGTCSCQACSASSDCPTNMKCNGTVCTSISCNKRSDCPQWSVCSGYGNSKYCTRPTIMPASVIFILIILTIVMIIAGYVAYRDIKK